MPLSDRFTRSTSDACSSIDRFLWMTPRPPCCAIAIARRDSVTVSIAALTSGTFSRMLRVSRVLTSTCVGHDRRSAAARAARRRRSGRWRGRLSMERTRGAVRFVYIHTLCRGPVALLVFLPAAARARVVAADLRLVAPHGLHRRIVAADARRLLLSLRPARTGSACRRLRARRAEQRATATPPPGR